MTQLRTETLEHLGIDPDDLDASGSANLDLLINRSFWEVMDKFDFKDKQDTKTFNTIAGTRNYSLATILTPNLVEAIDNIGILDPNDNQHSGLNPISENYYEDNYNEQTTLQAKPTNYFHNNSYIYLWPTPDAIYTITVWHKKLLTDLGTGVDPTIPQTWHEIIMLGAVYRGFLRARDITTATTIRNHQLGLIGTQDSVEAKEDKSNKFAGVQVYGRDWR